MACAIISFPVPDSPRMRAVVAVEATWATCSYTFCMGRLLPMMLRKS
jgi:hypothetical protein